MKWKHAEEDMTASLLLLFLSEATEQVSIKFCIRSSALKFMDRI
jgi:hypothetical protein